MKKPTAWEAKLRKTLAAYERSEQEQARAYVAGLSERGRMRLTKKLIRDGAIPYEVGVALLAKANSPKPASHRAPRRPAGGRQAG
jgi:hypothetical protein